MQPENGSITVECSRSATHGKWTIVVRMPDGASHTDVVNLLDRAKRERFVSSVLEKFEAVDPEALRERLEDLAAENASTQSDHGGLPRGASDARGATSTERCNSSANETDFPLTDIGNAERLKARHGKDLCYVAQWGWLHWDGRRWRRDDTRNVELLAKETVRAILFEEAKNAEPDKQYRDALILHARRSENDARIRAMLARAIPEMPGVPCDFDVDAWLLNVENGTIELKTGLLREHRREDKITKLAPVMFDPDARSADLETFLTFVTDGDPEFRSYVERVFGYSVAGSVRDDLIGLVTGPGGTGKTTFLEAMRAMLGEYAVSIPFECLLTHENEGGGPRPELARCAGARIVTASEVEEGRRFSAATIKSLAGGDRLTVSAKFKDPFELMVTFTLLLAANCPPRFGHGSDDTAARRRLVVLPFLRQPRKVDTGLRERLRSPEARSALLAVCVRGCLAWQTEGIGSCAAVDAATAKYWGDSRTEDDLELFIAICCVQEPGAVTPAGELYARYDATLRAQGRSPSSAKRFGMDLEGRGFVAFQATDGKRMRRGLRLVNREEGP